MEEHRARNLDQGEAIRNLEKMWQQQLLEMKQALQEKAREKVRQNAGGYASYNERLAAQEADRDAQERQQATEEHQVKSDEYPRSVWHKWHCSHARFALALRQC